MREIYFARIDTSGHKIGADVRITNTSIESTRPKLAWNGTEFRPRWWFDSAALLHAPGFQRSRPRASEADRPVPGLADLVWTGTEYRLAGAAGAVRLDPFGDPKGPLAALTALRSAWTGDVSGIVWMSNIAGRSEILFTRWGSTCVDGDGDGVASSEDCNDTNQSVFPGARELCDGVENDCRRTTWAARATARSQMQTYASASAAPRVTNRAQMPTVCVVRQRKSESPAPVSPFPRGSALSRRMRR